jgi:hypothetical protein
MLWVKQKLGIKIPKPAPSHFLSEEDWKRKNKMGGGGGGAKSKVQSPNFTDMTKKRNRIK